MFFDCCSIVVSIFHENGNLWRFNPNTKIIFFARGQTCSDVPASDRSVFMARLEEFFILVDTDVICRMLALTKQMIEFRRSVPLEVLFEDRTRRRMGSFRITCVVLGLDLYKYNNINGRGVGSSIVWLDKTSRAMNAESGIHSFLYENESAFVVGSLEYVEHCGCTTGVDLTGDW